MLRCCVCCWQVEAVIDEYFNSGDMQEASTTLQVSTVFSKCLCCL